MADDAVDRPPPTPLLQSTRHAVSLTAEEMRGASVRTGDEMERLNAAAVGGFVLGDWGALLAAATTRTALLAVAVTREGRDEIVTFRVHRSEGLGLLRRRQEQRAAAGLAPLPSLEELAGPSAQDRLLAEIRDHAIRQTALLERIAELLEPGRP